jgi:hypothetical protein
MLLNKEQIELMTADECNKHLKLFTKTYPLDKTIDLELWPQVDSIANTLIWLEDHITYCRQRDNALENNKIRWGTE